MCSKTYTLLDVYRWIFGMVLDGREDVASLLRSYQKQVNEVMFQHCLSPASSPLLWLPLTVCTQPAPISTQELGMLGLWAVRDVLLTSFLIKKSLKNPREDITARLRMFGSGGFEITTGNQVLTQRLRLRAMVGARVICCNLLGKGIWFDASF